MNAATWLLQFRRDEYSQTGEDGVIEKILDLLPRSDDRWCVEFGAWDGVFLTNTRHLIVSQGFSAVLIEADRNKYLELRRNHAHQQRVIALNRLVGFGDADNLDCILSDTPIPRDFDLLSIDIDGNDYHVWKRITYYQPRVVVIEFNPTIPTAVHFVQPANPAITQGSSLLSLVELGKAKGYELVCVLPFNAIFVQQQYFHLFQMESNEPHVLRTDLGAITYLFTGYDGRAFLRGACKLPWHGIELHESHVQPLPWFIRGHPGHYSRIQRLVFATFCLIRGPVRFTTAFCRRICHL